jgi:DNA-binding CsgD family transcriptional regulator
MAGRFVEAGAVALPLLGAESAEVRIRAIAPAGIGLILTGRCEEALGLTDDLLGPAMALAPELPPAPSWVASVRVFALLAAGRLDELDRFLDLVAEVGTGDRFSESSALLRIARGRAAILRGRPRTASEHLQVAAAVAQHSSRSEVKAWAASLLAEARALGGDRSPDGDLRHGPLTVPEPSRGSLHYGDAARSHAWVLAARGDRTAARARAMAVADACREEGQSVHELAALHDALRLGSRSSTIERILALGSGMEGELAATFVEHARALGDDDGHHLDVVADRFEAMGALLLAAEAAAHAAAAFGRAGLRARSSTAAGRSAALESRCEGASTPVLRERSMPARLTAREHDIAALAASGMTSKDIAHQLALSQRTVDNGLQRAFRKLGINAREQLAGALDQSVDS